MCMLCINPFILSLNFINILWILMYLFIKVGQNKQQSASIKII